MYSDSKINLESFLYSYYIKYDKLLELINSIDIPHPNMVDVYIDIYDMIKSLYTKDLLINKRFLVVSSIINLAAHMRGYFRTRHGLHSRIFLVYGEDITMNHRQFIPSFGNDYFKDTVDFERINKNIQSQLDMVKLLAGYIYDVYFVRKSTNFAMFVTDSIINSVNPSFIITKSKYSYQIPAMNSNAFILRPKKTADGDNSFLIYKNNSLIRLYDDKSNKTKEQLSKINPELMSLIMTLSGLLQYGLGKICNITTTCNLIINAITNNRILNKYNSAMGDYLYNALNYNNISPDYFRFRFNAIDLTTQFNIYKSQPESKDISWNINLSDPDTVRNINNNYFIDNPLDLNNL